MAIKENNWQVGDVVTLPRETKPLKRTGSKSYEQCIGSRYICIREASSEQRGILLKVLGKMPRAHIMMVGGQPFTKDDRAELFDSLLYYSYPFPDVSDIREVLDILLDNNDLLKKFEDALMHVNPRSRFWVSDTQKHLLVMKRALCYDSKADSLLAATSNDAPYRLTMVYFQDGKLTW